MRLRMIIGKRCIPTMSKRRMMRGEISNDGATKCIAKEHGESLQEVGHDDEGRP